MDFTLGTYNLLLESFLKNNYHFQTFKKHLIEPGNKLIVLRHDVDKLPENSLIFAKIQNEKGISGSYYFRAVPKSWNEKIIKEIADLGHEIGYHYENLDTCNGDIDKAWDDFRYNLDKLRKLIEVKTICMHGSPRSKFDNRDLWNKYDYRSLGIIGEPYYDVDFNRVFYLTDTGRCWDGWRASVRDKVKQQYMWNKQGLVFHSTSDIISAVEKGELPLKIIFTFHPQRWNDKAVPWLKEYFFQNFKNQIKKVVLIKR